MGYYINQNSKNQPLGSDKSAALIADGAKKIPQPEGYKENLVCVVSNGSWDAAAYIYSQGEFEAFADPNDTRRKTWLEYEHAKELAD